MKCFDQKYILATATWPLSGFDLSIFKQVDETYWQKLAARNQLTKTWEFEPPLPVVWPLLSLKRIWQNYNVQFITEEEAWAELL